MREKIEGDSDAIVSDRERCTRQFVLTAVRNARFLSSRVGIDRCIAENAGQSESLLGIRIFLLSLFSDSVSTADNQSRLLVSFSTNVDAIVFLEPTAFSNEVLIAG